MKHYNKLKELLKCYNAVAAEVEPKHRMEFCLYNPWSIRYIENWLASYIYNDKRFKAALVRFRDKNLIDITIERD
jgi:hypothetical protein